MFKNFFELLYPNNCICCNNHLVESENFVCTFCILDLPYTNYHKQKDNALEKVFWGRVKIEKAIAMFFFKKGGNASKILHALKYNENPEIATFLGRFYAPIIKDFVVENNIEAVVAIPLHKKKLEQRGYNQSLQIALGLAEYLKINDLSKLVIRNKNTETQTRKSRIDRNENVKSIFEVIDPKNFENKHILLVDDVITTGATIESCATEFLKIKDCKISILGLAFANN